MNEKNIFEESIDLIGSHYTLNSRSESFWRQARAQIKKSKTQLMYSKILKDPTQSWGEGEAEWSFSFFSKKNWLTWLTQQ